ncbi:DUF5063 domain-containing protein [Myxococcus qinghaiensis]|uniref:DUF5063 domain-containing protein n=1 Tax=Myxococcus qinghaiensis TaxID=2906758 RepID=UPI0020A7D1C7|nr:DUF5063 domain-containing protein [Myxococcus qinghaiensis]MCP3163123.1 DUF5063 domain-containing protein [Myxococcus qinghaiensis]
MTRDEILGAMTSFLSVIERSLRPEHREVVLREALDRLALASHFAEAPLDGRSASWSPPHPADDSLRARIAPLFPGLGYYNVASELAERVGESPLVVGDALDDLVDIVKDIQAVVTCWETAGEAEALWLFRFGFTSHWGTHLRSLQLYLHARAHGLS